MIRSTLTIAAAATAAVLWMDCSASAQGSTVAFVSDRDGNPDIYTLGADGSDLRRITTHPGIDRAPTWSPDGRQIAFVSDRLGPAALFRVDVQTGEVALLLEADGVGQSLDSSSLAWSPDGDYLAYSIRDNERRELFVEVLSMRTGAKKRLQKGMRPSWSPDGARLAFNAGQFPQIVVMQAEGGEPVALLRKPAGTLSVDLGPIWSPDGLSILFSSADLRQGRTNPNVYVQRIDEDTAVRLTDSPGRDQAYGWSPDAARFVFVSDRDGNSEIYIGSLDGEGPRNLTSHPGSDTEPNWGRAASASR